MQLSIDVGIRNLALCVQDQTTRQIHFWQCIDVLGDDAPREAKMIQMAEKCQNILKKSKRPCGKKAVTVNSRGRPFCGVHNPSKRHSPDDTQRWCWAMLRHLPTVMAELSAGNIEQVVIEQQSPKSLRMLMLSNLIYGYFVQEFKNEVQVRLVPAYNKLKVYMGPDIPCALKTKYARNKFLAKKHTESILAAEPVNAKWLHEVFLKSKKQDDLADAFLQGRYYLSPGGKK